MRQTAMQSTCLLFAILSILSGKNEVINIKNINVQESSMLTVMNAKNAAIKSFVEEVMFLLNQGLNAAPANENSLKPDENINTIEEIIPK
jgi:hypothetical protein